MHDTPPSGPTADPTLEALAISVIRGLSMDAPRAANSGHQGTAMALAPLAHVLWTRILRYDAASSEWPDRDRFVLSAGHASILQYAMLHLTGYGLTLDDLKAFRQWGSATPGHPEVHHTAGVEVTTGPLGQGFANGVGMAIAERSLRARFGLGISNHHIYGVVGDGDLSEGISHEAASLAGHQGLGRLVYVYDDNHVSIDGPTELSLSDDAAKRFESYGWHVQDLGESGEDLDALETALRAAAAVDDAPSLVIVRTHIGYPSPGQTDSPAAHGLSFDAEEIARTKEVMGLPPDEAFYVPDEVLAMYRAAGERGRAQRVAWEERRAALDERTGAELTACLDGTGLEGWESKLPSWSPGEKMATRQANAKVLDAIVDVVPGLVSGGADLTGNTGTTISGATALTAADPAGRQLYFGVREHAMGAVMNGMALHGGTLPAGGTFLVFSDYMRPAVRLAAISRAKAVFCWSHDSVGVGEDGPTHQPVEHIAALRAIPGLRVIRPADPNEVAQAWRVAVAHDGPTAIITSRQSVPVLEGTAGSDGLRHGGYTLSEAPGGSPELVLVGTGSEVSLCVEAAERLSAGGVATRVVSLPSWDLFADQPGTYRSSVLPRGVPTVSVEAGVTFGWERYADASVGIDRFGESAPGEVVLDRLGINVDNVVSTARALLGPATN